MSGADPGTVAAYQAAVASGDTSLANYLAQAIAASAGINVNANQVTAAPNSMVNPGYSSSSQPPKGFFGNLAGGIDQAIPALGSLDSMFGVNPGAPDAGSTGATVSNVITGTGSFLSFISDIPRVVTLLVGLMILTVGFFMLADKSVIQTVVKAAAK